MRLDARGMTIALAIVLAMWGCKELPPRDTDRLPDWSDGMDTDTDTDSDSDTDTDTDTDTLPANPFALTAAPDVRYDTRLEETSVGTPCAVVPGETAADYVDMDCTLDIAELDLYGNALDFDFIVAAGLCEFVVYWHYMYEAWEVGIGPTEVSWSIDGAGNIFNPVNATTNGSPICEYDYSRLYLDAPNCCLGTYILTITDVASPADPQISPPLFWGGVPSDCYDGAAFHDPEAIYTNDGWPVARILYLNQDSWTKRFHWDLLATDYYSNVPLANYYDPADHGGTMPAGFTGDWARPYYTFQCYDHAEELLAQLKLSVREWNEQSEFYDEGDPDTTGTEPVTGLPIDDRMDWATGTPGNTTWIEFLQ